MTSFRAKSPDFDDVVLNLDGDKVEIYNMDGSVTLDKEAFQLLVDLSGFGKNGEFKTQYDPIRKQYFGYFSKETTS